MQQTIKSAMGKLRGVDLSETNGFPTDENVQNGKLKNIIILLFLNMNNDNLLT